MVGGDSWIRTNDLLRMKQLHYRCAISPLLVPLLRFELRELLLLREMTLPICPQGHWYRETGSNRPHLVLQTSALPTELSRQFSLG